MVQTRSLVRFVVVIGFILALLVSQVPVLRSDFASFFAAATIVRTEPGRLYDQNLQFEIQGRLGKSGYLPFAYPPLAALIFVPFSLLGFQSAYFAWMLVSLALLLLNLYLPARRLNLSYGQADLLLLLTLLFFPVYVALVQGQLSMVVLLLFALFWTEKGDQRAGVWAGLLLIKPQLAIIPFLVLLLSRNWRGLTLGVATGILQVLASLALVGLAGFGHLLAVLSAMSSSGEVLRWLPRMHNLRQLSWFLGTQETGYFVLASITVLAFSVTWVLCGRSKWTMLAAVILSCLVSPHLFLHDLTLVLVAAAILISLRSQAPGYAAQAVWAASGLLTLLALFEYPIISGLLLAGFVAVTVKSISESLRAPVPSPGSLGLTEVTPPAHR